METRTALAEWRTSKLCVWTGTQAPFGYHRELARTFRLADRDGRGAGFGGGFGGNARRRRPSKRRDSARRPAARLGALDAGRFT
ncbi:MAG: molybdopterin-dependent oxidoreductase [Verrucomicrobiales bacterium]|nr:molybdopterin-dependent oxidoreductase [Verrucomicrobiales bacterium]